MVIVVALTVRKRHQSLLTPSSTPLRATAAVAPSRPASTTLRKTKEQQGPPTPRGRLDGQSFPDGLLALTWDDGPDEGTLDLAQYLHSEHVSGTFFVVSNWIRRGSEEPGLGHRLFQTGHENLPILGELVALGHRLGNHTRNHVLLTSVTPAELASQLAGADDGLAPFLTNELRIFRPPGGAWDDRASAVVDGDARLHSIEGPVFWDIDQKDWEDSVFCRSTQPESECETAPSTGRRRVRPAVVAARYLASIDRVGHGIVLLHDRVGDVGSHYAIDIARSIIPTLKARGFVFVAPLIQLSPLSKRLPVDPDCFPSRTREGLSVLLVDINGDGRSDACLQTNGPLECAVSEERQGPSGPITSFRWALPSLGAPDGGAGTCERFAPLGQWALADVSGSGRASRCGVGAAGVFCRGAPTGEQCGAPSLWLPAPASSRPVAFAPTTTLGHVTTSPATLRFADVDGDGKDDACAETPLGVVCARGHGDGFQPARVWLRRAAYTDVSAEPVGELLLGDLNGDGRADACVSREGALVCALSTGTELVDVRTWSTADELVDHKPLPGYASDGSRSLWLADLNGDGRSDVCRITQAGLFCGLSDGHAFTRPTNWLAPVDRSEWSAQSPQPPVALGDINGDGRADLCVVMDDGLYCGLAP
jgi:peptidoglycan/xylan/chitin deacetylase (PgdA/CDA1 family)